MKNYAVVTGDIISSSKIRGPVRNLVLNKLKEGVGEITKQLLKNKKKQFEIFGGDSFQMMLEEPELAMLVGILIRAKLRELDTAQYYNTKRSIQRFDARIAIGIGKIDFIRNKIVESDGEAFRNSGLMIMEMKKQGINLKVKTPWTEADKELQVSSLLADNIISGWSAYQAEAAYLYLLYNLTQAEIAQKLKISQSGIYHRLEHGSVESIKTFIKRFEEIIEVRNDK